MNEDMIWIHVSNETPMSEQHDVLQTVEQALPEYQIIVTPNEYELMSSQEIGRAIGRLFMACGIDHGKPLIDAIPELVDEDSDEDSDECINGEHEWRADSQMYSDGWLSKCAICGAEKEVTR